jgi:hypothetical protein
MIVTITTPPAAQGSDGGSRRRDSADSRPTGLTPCASLTASDSLVSLSLRQCPRATMIATSGTPSVSDSFTAGAIQVCLELRCLSATLFHPIFRCLAYSVHQATAGSASVQLGRLCVPAGGGNHRAPAAVDSDLAAKAAAEARRRAGPAWKDQWASRNCMQPAGKRR